MKANTGCHRAQQEILPDIGVPASVRAGAGPARKQLFLYGGPSKSGKSRFLAHVARKALLAKYKVLVVTLEMSAEEWQTRMVQNIFSMPSRGEAEQVKITYPKLLLDRDESVDSYSVYRRGDEELLNVAKFGAKLKGVNRPSLRFPGNWQRINDA